MKIHIVILYTDGVTMGDIIGVFDDEHLDDAKKLVKECNECCEEDFVCGIQTFTLNHMEDYDSEIGSEIQNLLDMGIIDYTIGEDGEFYFHPKELK